MRWCPAAGICSGEICVAQGLLRSCDSSAGEFPVQEKGWSAPPQHGRQTSAYSLWAGRERGIPHMGPSILSGAADGAGGRGARVSPHFSPGLLWLLPAVCLSVSASGSSQRYWVLMTYFLFGSLRVCGDDVFED